MSGFEKPRRGPVPEVASQYRLIGEWGAWLSTLDKWTHFFTGTFHQERKTPGACARSFENYLDSLQRHKIKGRAFVVVEGDQRVRLHVHALTVLDWDASLVSTPSLLPDGKGRLREARGVLAWKRWFQSRGRCRCDEIHGTSTGAAFYVAKYLLKTKEPRYYFLPDEAWGTTVRG